MIDNVRIKTFVQKTLGCNCPEEVFDSIDCRSRIRISRDVVLDYSITIGSRLLVYVVEASSQTFVEENLALLVATGQKERDTRGLNRVRLVIFSDADMDRESLQAQFAGQKERDEKIHLHILRKEDDILSAPEKKKLSF